MRLHKRQHKYGKNIMEKNNVTPLVPKDKKDEDESFVNSLSNLYTTYL